MSFYTQEELATLGLGSYGSRVLISKKASIYNPGSIHIGNNVRIDDYCILSPGEAALFTLGSYIHMGCFSLLIGSSDIHFEDFSGISSYVGIYSSSDDFSGSFLTNPTVPLCYRKIRSRSVLVGRHVVIGTKSTVLPGAILGEGSAVLAHSLVYGRLDSYSVYSGNPAAYVRPRMRRLLELESDLSVSQGSD
jgi:acetyltransferase-like isoleucine patch superfamily enzyme